RSRCNVSSSAPKCRCLLASDVLGKGAVLEIFARHDSSSTRRTVGTRRLTAGTHNIHVLAGDWGHRPGPLRPLHPPNTRVSHPHTMRTIDDIYGSGAGGIAQRR